MKYYIFFLTGIFYYIIINKMFEEIIPQVREIIRKISKYNTCYSEEDYIQEAYIAYLEAKNRYEKIRNKKRVAIQENTYIYWHVEKRLHKMADTGEVAYEMYSPKGKYIRTVYNGEYRKSKKHLASRGYTFRAIKISTSVDAPSNGNGNGRQIANEQTGYDEYENYEGYIEEGYIEDDDNEDYENVLNKEMDYDE